MIFMSLKDTIYSLKMVWDSAKKPTWEEVKKTANITLSFFALVGLLSILIFISIQSILMFSSFLFVYQTYVLIISIILLATLLYMIFFKKS